MENIQPSLPQRVDGVVFRRSAIKTIGLIAGCILVFLFGLLLAWGKISDEVVGPVKDADQRVTWYGLLFGIGAMLVAPCIVVQLVRSLRAKRRLIVGADRLQLIEILGGDDTVVLQIPYSNIADIKYEATRSHRRVGIDLLKPAAPGNYARSENFEANKKIRGRHFCITTGYEGGPRAIATAIDSAYKKWARK